MLTFPTNPQLDDEFQRWRWDGAKWVRIGAEPPAPPGLFTPTAPGIVPASGGGLVNFLRADGTWSAPPAPTPPAPQTGDVRFDSGKLERWDGTAWQEIPVGGWPVQGVTDGSNAAPGEVGEELASSILTYSLSNMLQDFTNTPMSGGQPVPAGDWLVYGAVSVTLGAMTVFNTAGFVGYSVSLDNGLSNITDSFYVGATTLGTYPPFAKSYRLTPARLRLSAPRTLPVTASARLMTVTVPANVQIQFSLVGRALRVR